MTFIYLSENGWIIIQVLKIKVLVRCKTIKSHLHAASPFCSRSSSWQTRMQTCKPVEIQRRQWSFAWSPDWECWCPRRSCWGRVSCTSDSRIGRIQTVWETWSSRWRSTRELLWWLSCQWRHERRRRWHWPWDPTRRTPLGLLIRDRTMLRRRPMTSCRTRLHSGDRKYFYSLHSNTFYFVYFRKILIFYWANILFHVISSNSF